MKPHQLCSSTTAALLPLAKMSFAILDLVSGKKASATTEDGDTTLPALILMLSIFPILILMLARLLITDARHTRYGAVNG